MKKILLFTLAVGSLALAQDRPIVPSGYILGPNDQISVFVKDMPEEFADKTFRIDESGEVSLPVAGHIHAAGLTISELEQACGKALVHELKDPRVSISLAAFGSQTVSVLGAVNLPGPHQLEGHKTLFEILSLAGGLRVDAGYEVTVTRDMKWGAIPVAQAITDPSGKTSVASVKVKSLMRSSNPADNFQIFPGDIVSVPVTDRVYAVGCVTMPGAFALNEHDTLSALQVVSLAQGPTKVAALSRAKILRSIPGQAARAEIPVNLKQLMSGKGPDVQLRPDDILFIPTSNTKAVGYRTIDAVASAAGYAVVRPY